VTETVTVKSTNEEKWGWRKEREEHLWLRTVNYVMITDVD